MAGVQPGFITGANAKIKVFGKVMAYCSDVGYNITVQTIPIESIGKYEPHSNEPVSYSVDGTFSIIRYTKGVAGTGTAGGPFTGASTTGNAPFNIGATGQSMQTHLDPSKILNSQTFDLEIYQKGVAASDGEQAIISVKDCRVVRRGMTLNKRGVMVDNYAFVGILATDTDIADTNQVGKSGETDLS